MKFTLWAPDFKDLPTIRINLPAGLSKKGVEILYGYSQPSKPYDRTLFVQLITPIKTSKSELRRLTTQLKNLIKKNWDKSHYKIIKVEEDFKASQSFIYFQLKRNESAMVSSKSLATPLKVPKIKETPAKAISRSLKKTRRKAAKKTTRKSTTRRSTKKTLRRKATKRSTRKTTRKTSKKTRRRR